MGKSYRAGKTVFGVVMTAVSLLGLFVSSSEAYFRPTNYRQFDHVPDEAAAVTIIGKEKDGYNSSLSDDAKWVAFDTIAALTPDDINDRADVYIRNLKTGRLLPASMGQHGESAVGLPKGICDGNLGTYSATGLSQDPAISGDGKYVVFASNALNLVPGDTNLSSDVFLYHLKTRSIERISVNSEEEQLDENDNGLPCSPSWSPAIDLHGAKVSFTSTAAEPSSGDGHVGADIFVRDVVEGTTKIVSAPVAGVDEDVVCLVDSVVSILCGDAASGNSAISSDGRFVAFDSGAGDLIEGDTNHVYDVFVRDLVKNTTERVSVGSSGNEVGAPRAFGVGTQDSMMLGNVWWADSEATGFAQHAISKDGRYVAFYSTADGLVPTDHYPAGGGSADIFVHDRQTKRTERVSVSFTGDDLGQVPTTSIPSISRDGRFVSFMAYNDVANSQYRSGMPTGLVTFVYDRWTGAQQMVARNVQSDNSEGCGGTFTESGATWTDSRNADISASGRYLSLSSCDADIQDYPGRSPSTKNRYSDRLLLADRGPIVGAGPGSGSSTDEGPPPPSGICVADICIPPSTPLSVDDRDVDAHERAADLLELRLAYRPEYGDLFVVQEVSRLAMMTQVESAGSVSPALIYGLRFSVGDTKYEVRESSLRGGSFVLLRCDAGPACSKIADLRGGYGTTGERLVFSLPLEELGLQDGGSLSDVEAFSALGGLQIGSLRVLDTISMSSN